MENKLYIATDNDFVSAAKRLKDHGEISLEQYATILRRANKK